ncbi:hypothetical protein [Mucisphaera sp.]|uniref:hypothetical protein n=1 Tax=Mucisphaera sp. TaxID=2913024 RepID=UPI003D1174F7
MAQVDGVALALPFWIIFLILVGCFFVVGGVVVLSRFMGWSEGWKGTGVLLGAVFGLLVCLSVIALGVGVVLPAMSRQTPAVIQPSGNYASVEGQDHQEGLGAWDATLEGLFPIEPALDASTSWAAVGGAMDGRVVTVHEDGEALVAGVFRTPRLAASAVVARRYALVEAAEAVAAAYAASEATEEALSGLLLDRLLADPGLVRREVTQEIRRPYGELYRSAVEVVLLESEIVASAAVLERKLLARGEAVGMTWAAMAAVLVGIVAVYLVLNVATQGYYGFTLALCGFGFGLVVVLYSLLRVTSLGGLG